MFKHEYSCWEYNKQTKKTNVFQLKPNFDLKLQKPNIPFILMVSWRHRGFLLFLMSLYLAKSMAECVLFNISLQKRCKVTM